VYGRCWRAPLRTRFRNGPTRPPSLKKQALLPQSLATALFGLNYSSFRVTNIIEKSSKKVDYENTFFIKKKICICSVFYRGILDLF
jgi:hypothetical protein